MAKEHIKAQTRDIGLAIRDFMEGADFFVMEDDPWDGELYAQASREVRVIDVSDPSNVVAILDNGQRFRITIISEG